MSIKAIASAYRSQGQFDDAVKQLLEASSVSVRVLGMHSESLATMHDLTLTYRKKRQLDKAESSFAVVIEGRKKVFGEEHQSTLETMHELACVYSEQNRLDEAYDLFLIVIETRQKVLGVEHEDTLKTREVLAETYNMQWRFGGANVIEVKFVEWAKNIIDGGDPPAAIIFLRSGLATHTDQDRADEVVDWTEQGLEVMVRFCGLNNPKFLDFMRRLNSVTKT